MSAIKSAVCLVKTTADGSEIEEAYYATEGHATLALAIECRGCGWTHTGFIGGETIIYDPLLEGDEVIAIAQVRMLG